MHRRFFSFVEICLVTLALATPLAVRAHSPRGKFLDTLRKTSEGISGRWGNILVTSEARLANYCAE